MGNQWFSVNKRLPPSPVGFLVVRGRVDGLVWFFLDDVLGFSNVFRCRVVGRVGLVSVLVTRKGVKSLRFWMLGPRRILDVVYSLLSISGGFGFASKCFYVHIRLSLADRFGAQGAWCSA
jgi:hypothetical protein